MPRAGGRDEAFLPQGHRRHQNWRADLLYLRATRVQQNLEPGAEHFETGVKRFTEMKGLSVDVKGWLQVEMGHFYLQWDRLPTAKQWYAQAKAMAPEGSDAYRDALLGSAMHASLSAGCERGGHKTKACADALLEYQRLEKLGHLDAASYFMYAHLLWYTARDPDGALKACNKAVSMNGGSTNPDGGQSLVGGRSSHNGPCRGGCIQRIAGAKVGT